MATFEEVAKFLEENTPVDVPLLGWLLDWGDLGSFLGGLFPTKLPNLPASQNWGTFLQRVGSPPGAGDDRVILRGQIAYHKDTGLPVTRWSFGRQRLLPVLGYDVDGYVVFVDDEGSQASQAGDKKLVETDIRSPIVDYRAQSEDFTRARTNALKAKVEGSWAPHVALRGEGPAVPGIAGPSVARGARGRAGAPTGLLVGVGLVAAAGFGTMAIIRARK